MNKVYIIYNTVNKKSFIGVTSRSVRRRFVEHFSHAANYKDHKTGQGMPLYDDMRAYDKEDFAYRVLFRDPIKSNAVAVKKHLIVKHGLHKGRGNNKTRGWNGFNDSHNQRSIDLIKKERNNRVMSYNRKLNYSGPNNGNAKLTAEEAFEIKLLTHHSQLKQKDIATYYNISPEEVSQIKNDRNWSKINIYAKQPVAVYG